MLSWCSSLWRHLEESIGVDTVHKGAMWNSPNPAHINWVASVFSIRCLGQRCQWHILWVKAKN